MPGTLDPSSQFIVVTPSDTAVLQYNGENKSTRGISFEVAGTLAIKNDEGVAVTLPGLAASVIHPLISDTIMATNTTATGIVAYF